MDEHRPIGEELRLAREAMGIKQAEAARMVKVTRLTWSNWERGIHLPKKHHGHYLRRFLALARGERADEELTTDREDPPPKTIREYALEHVETAVGVLAELAGSGDVDPKIRESSAKALLDRAGGTPAQEPPPKPEGKTPAAQMFEDMFTDDGDEEDDDDE